MHKIDSGTAVDGEFVEGSSSTGQQSTRLNAKWFNTVQRELVNIVESAGIALSDNDDSQVLSAVVKIALKAIVENDVVGTITIPGVGGECVIGGGSIVYKSNSGKQVKISFTGGFQIIDSLGNSVVSLDDNSGLVFGDALFSEDSVRTKGNTVSGKTYVGEVVPGGFRICYLWNGENVTVASIDKDAVTIGNAVLKNDSLDFNGAKISSSGNSFELNKSIKVKGDLEVVNGAVFDSFVDVSGDAHFDGGINLSISSSGTSGIINSYVGGSRSVNISTQSYPGRLIKSGDVMVHDNAGTGIITFEWIGIDDQTHSKSCPAGQGLMFICRGGNAGSYKFTMISG